MWQMACRDWEDRLLTGRSLVPDLPLFEDEAARAVRIFNRLMIPDVIGTPAMAQAAGDWVRDIVRALFGAYDAKAQRRMIQEVFLLVPKKNSKSSSAAAIMVTALIVNQRPSAEFLLIAPTKEIADISFRQASGTILLDPELAKLFHIQRHIRLITHRRSGATLQVKAADTDVITGSKSTGILVDETHVFAARARAADVFVEIRGALAARPDGFMFQITTQSKDPPSGVFATELRNARDVRDGKLALPLLPVLYELPDRIAREGGWKDRRFWPMVNPNLGRSVDQAFLEREIVKAEREGPEKLRLIASQHFNVQVGMSLRTDGWVGAQFWQAQADRGLTYDELVARSEVVVIGIDGGGLDDLYGLTAIGRDRETKDWLAWSSAWAHPVVLERRQSIATHLREFEAAGELTITEEKLADVLAIVAMVQGLQERGLLGGVGVDPAGIGALVEALAEIEVTADSGLLIGVPQGFGLMTAIKTAERKLADGTLIHAGQAITAWCIGNLRIEPTATAIRATKQNAGDAKIDVAMSLFNAVFLMARNPTAAPTANLPGFLSSPIFA